MLLKVLTVTVLLVLKEAKCEPPISSHYGTPLAPPISSYDPPPSGYHNANHGHHNDHDYSEPQAYEFGYQVKDDHTGNNYNRREQSDGNQVRGEYRVQLPDGRTQIVTYYADWQTGFHADVRYEGEASYPDQYNQNHNGYQSGHQSGYQSGHQQQNGYQGSYQNRYNQNGGGYDGGYQGAPATSSVSIKDYSNGGYNGGRVGPTPVYGAP